ncbi:MAG: relaxase/mobilization nuclease domain-containing protein [Pseudomonadota bacterium]
MILNGSQRAGGQSLAVHLMRMDENEHVEVHELRGFASDTLSGAFKEAHAISRATKCQQYLFSLSLNPPETKDVPVEDFEAAIAKIEAKLGLQDQPRAIVFHEKEGRRHAHCVWSRIDGEELRAKPLPHFKRKLCDVSRELYLEHSWKMPRGLMHSAERDPTNFTLEEWQQAKRAGADPREVKSAIQDCWAVSDSRASFEHALQERGFWLARGDRRGFVVIDYTGEVRSVPRVLGLKTKVVRERLGDEGALLSVTQTKHRIAERMTPTICQHIESARRSFEARTIIAERQRTEMVQRQRTERTALKQAQAERADKEAKQRASALPTGLKGLWARVTGRQKSIQAKLEADARAAMDRDRTEWRKLKTAQLIERRSLQRRRQSDREAQAQLLRQLRRDASDYNRMGREPERYDEDRKRRRSRQARL